MLSMASHLSSLEPALDLQRFVALNGRLDLYEAVLPVFVQQAQTWLVAFAAALDAGDDVQVLDLLHKMRGSSAGICATRLCDGIKAAEALVLNAGLVVSRRSLEHIARELAELNLLLTGFVEPRSSAPPP